MHRYFSRGLHVLQDFDGEESLVAVATNAFRANLIAYRLNQAEGTC